MESYPLRRKIDPVTTGIRVCIHVDEWVFCNIYVIPRKQAKPESTVVPMSTTSLSIIRSYIGPSELHILRTKIIQMEVAERH